MNNSRIKRVAFADESVRDSFLKLQEGRYEEKKLATNIQDAIILLKGNPFAGERISRNKWPKYYVRKYGIDNLRRLDLPGAWRLIYYLRGNEVEIVSIILEWFDHKGYDKRFGYKVG